MPYEGYRMTGHQFRNGNFDKVILPCGSFENHGNHLPFSTDALVAYRLALQVAEQVPGTLVLPPVNYGRSSHYAGFPITLGLRSDTLISVYRDILQSVIDAGINHILVFNGHDGNIAPIEIATRDIKVKNPQAKIASVDAWWELAGQLLPEGTFDVWNGLGHAGEGETSMALTLFGDWVEMEHADGVVPVNLPEGSVDVKWRFSELTDVGATGDPTKATVEKGEKMREVLVAVVSNFLKEMDSKDWHYESDRHGSE